MKVNKTLTALIASAGLGLSGHAFAAGTASGTVIQNTVTLGYTVDSQAQDAVSASEDFTVDTKVDFTLVLQSSATQNVTPGKDYVATYLLTNTGNATLNFDLSSKDLVNGGPYVVGDPNASSPVSVNDDDNLNTISIRIENDGEYDTSGTVPSSSFDEATDAEGAQVTSLQADYAQVVYLYVNVDSSSVDGSIAVAELKVESPLTDSKGTVNGEDVVDVVFADALFDGSETINAGFEVVTARFTHRNDADTADVPGPGLTFKVINDTVCDSALDADTTKVDYSTAGCTITNASGNNENYKPKAIPGAMVEYTIKAKNTGGATATGVSFVQNLLNTVDPASTIHLQADSLRNVASTFTGAGTDDTSSSTDNVLTVSVDSFAVNDEITITFTAIID